jgi:Cytochrome c7 and related cytochrome c/Class III cytochrome C family
MRFLGSIGVIVGLIVVAAAQTPEQARRTPPAPSQPVAFSHKVHAGQLKLKCSMCHANPDPGERMGIATASTCMNCHSAIKADSPEIQKVADAAKTARPIRWTRVYSIPSYVFFSHRTHLEAGNTCAECHGQVAERDRLFREADISMGGCMACHSEKGASNDCTFCHEAR